MKTIESNIATLLKLHWHLRNSDQDLIFVYWAQHDNFNAVPSKPLTSASSIIRARAKLQHHGLFIPTDPKVRKQRRIKQTKMRKYALQK
jgi:hypothetical protein